MRRKPFRNAVLNGTTATANTLGPSYAQGAPSFDYFLRLFPDGRRIVTGSADTTPRSGMRPMVETCPRSRAHHGTDWSVDFSPERERNCHGAHDDTAKVWDAAKRQRIGHPQRAQQHRFRLVTFSPTANGIATAAWDGTAKIWDVASDRDLFTSPTTLCRL